jgi:hypothetical protein
MKTPISTPRAQAEKWACDRSSEPLKRRGFGALISLVLLLLSSAFQLQAATVEVTQYSVPGYLIDSKADSIAVQAGYLYPLNFSDPLQVNVELRFRLLNPSGTAMPLNVGGVSQPFMSVTDSFARPNNSTPRTVNANLRPFARLLPGTLYRVQVEVIPYSEIATEVPGRSYIHFLNDGPAARLNVVMEMLQPTLNSDYLINTVAGKDQLSILAPYTLHRFAPDAAAATVSCRFTLRLVDDEDKIVSTANTTHTSEQIAGTHAGQPISQLGVAVFTMPPGAQLDSVNRTYRLQIITAHNDLPSGELNQPQNTVISVAKRILHFNGVLQFGSESGLIGSIFTQVSNNPAAGVIADGGVTSTLTIPAGGAALANGAAYAFGNGSHLPVRLMPNGTAIYTGESFLPVSQPANDKATLAGVKLERVDGGLEIGPSGARAAALKVRLPNGLGYAVNAEDRLLSNTLTASNVALNAQLLPTAATIPFATQGWFNEESKPVMVQFNGVTWTTAQGSFAFTTVATEFVRKTVTDTQEEHIAFMTNAAAGLRRSNDHYYRAVAGWTNNSAAISTAENGDAQLTGTLTFGVLAVNKFLPHFPYAVQGDGHSLSFASGQMKIELDQVVPASSFLSTVPIFALNFDRSCATIAEAAACPSDGVQDWGLLFFQADDVGGVTRPLRFTRDGGLSAQGTLIGADALLKWGKDPEIAARYAQELSAKFNRGGYHMPGHFLAGGTEALDPLFESPDNEETHPVNGPAAILLSGVIPFSANSPDSLERPGIAEVKEGEVPAYGYALGYGDYAGLNMRVSTQAMRARSVIGNLRSVFYDLATSSKYYVRASGVSGRHQALDFAGDLVIYDYDLELTRYGLGYLSNLNTISDTAGEIDIPAPSNVTFPFEEMTFTCTGGIKAAEVAKDAVGVKKVLGMGYWDADFYPLAYIFATDNPCSEAPKFGVLSRAFCSLMPGVALNGPLGFETNGQLLRPSDGNSRLNSRLVLPSNCELPGPGNETYTFEPATTAYLNHQPNFTAGPGFMTLLGKLRVPFFRSTSVAIHSTAREEPGPALSVPYHIMRKHVNITSDPPVDDLENRGYPTDASLAVYREAGRGRGPSAPDYTPKARAIWLGVTNMFDFDIAWDSTSRTFTSLDSSTDLFIVETRSKLELLTPSVAKLNFGLDYGIKKLDLTGFVTDASQRGTDWLATLTDAAGDELANTMKSVIDTGEAYVKSNLEEVMDDLLGSVLDGQIDALRDSFEDRVDSEIDVLLGPIDGFTEDAVDAIQGSIPNSVVQDINTHLNNATSGIGGIQAVTTPAGFGTLGRSFIRKNAPGLAGTAATVFSTNNLTRNPVPGLADLNQRANEITGYVDDLRDLTNNGANGVEQQLEAAILASVDDLRAAIKRGIQDALRDLIISAPGGQYAVDIYGTSEAELKARIKKKVVQALLQSEFATRLRQVAHEKIDAVSELYRESFRSLFTLINAYVQAEATKHLQPIDNEVNGVLGPLRRWLGTGQLIGYAQINGDTLRELRLDGKFQWKCPSNLEYKGSLTIKQLHTKTDGGECVREGIEAHEVTITAKDVDVAWVLDGLKANISVMAIVESNPVKEGFIIQGIGGSVESAKPFKYEAFSVEKIGFGVSMSGQYGTYLVAAARMKLDAYEVGGGLFFGTTCSIAPLAMVDPEFAGSIGTPPFSGAYVYGMGRFPIINAGCALRVSIGIGAGFFYFTEGHVLGARFTGEVSGEAICLVNVSGKLDILARYSFESKSKYAEGQLRLKGKAGKCPFCVKFGKTFKMAYDDGKLKKK